MSIKYDFTGKVALITGSSSGIGAATAQLFAKSGANVVVTGRNADSVAKVAKQCTDVSPKQLPALEVVGDLTNDEDCNRLIETTVQTFGKIDILVNSAGSGFYFNIDATDFMEKFSLALKTNLNSLVYMTHKCVPHLAKTRGNIINISSVSSKKSSSGESPYCVSKAAVNMFTKCMAAELGPKRIRVNAILSGVVDTNFNTVFEISKELIDEINKSIGQKYPVGRVGQPEDIANTVAYLASDTAAGFLTGSLVVADGGDIAANVSYD
ncbi:3-oxoacyl-[acyl-carrier-protein] reductase FabG-like [Oppia nitens]|uniref:3-oxoacyl-[acyl-carrier-protein] reductase FabG-like n=1 Tax=Oppia nitens TaxID=1686743 RepID=UPI0023D9B000|nr:3-oxoacyl-[acyl-carrier-protein] reductase FabG-like [Oppia nitens]